MPENLILCWIKFYSCKCDSLWFQVAYSTIHTLGINVEWVFLNNHLGVLWECPTLIDFNNSRFDEKGAIFSSTKRDFAGAWVKLLYKLLGSERYVYLKLYKDVLCTLAWVCARTLIPLLINKVRYFLRLVLLLCLFGILPIIRWKGLKGVLLLKSTYGPNRNETQLVCMKTKLVLQSFLIDLDKH